MSRQAWLYISSVLSAGTAVSIFTLVSRTPLESQWLTFLVLTILATIAQLFVAEAPNHVFYYATPVFLFAALFLIDPSFFVALVILSSLTELVKERVMRINVGRAWYIQPFNIATDILAGLSARWIYTTLTAYTSPLGTFSPVFAGLAAATGYVVFNHTLLGQALVLARGKSWRDTGMLMNENVLSDLILLLLGYVVAVLWELNPWLIVPALAPLGLMYRALAIPQLKHEAQTDGKTGLLNSRFFTKRFEEEIERAKRINRPLAVVMADLDYLRTINNTYGHLAGDAVLVGISQILRQTIRNGDLVARFGGEEFAVVLPQSGRADAYRLAERIRAAVAEAEFVVDTSAAPIHATMSFGIACFPDDANATTGLTHAADIAVYHAKNTGRNRVVYIGDMPPVVRETIVSSMAAPAPVAPPDPLLANQPNGGA